MLFTNHSFTTHDFPRFPTISHDFPAFPGPPPTPPPPIKCPRAVRLSWSASRDCRPRPVAAFLRVVARHGAAVARHGRHGAPRAAVRAPSAPATRPLGFSRITRHETRDTAIAWRAASDSANSEVFTKHETRDTNHGFYRRAVRRGCEWFAQPTAAARTAAPVTQSLFSCSLLFTKKYFRSQCPRAVRRSRAASLQAPLAGESRKSVQNPGSPGESTRHAVRCSSLRLPARSSASHRQ